MNRWVVRLIGIVMLLVFLILFAHLQRRLIELQRTRGAVPVKTSS